MVFHSDNPKKHLCDNVVLKCCICGKDAYIVYDEPNKPACECGYCAKHQPRD